MEMEGVESLHTFDRGFGGREKRALGVSLKI